MGEVEQWSEPEAWFNSRYKGPTVTFTTETLDGLGDSLIKLRKVREWTQADLAARLNMKQQQVQRYEINGWQNISMWRLQEVAEALGVRMELKVHLGDGLGETWRDT